MDVPARLIENQRRASDPAGSSWVRANAGAGKTYVLAQRVLRLLLAGTEPSRILCITYTKAAAAEMANRVFGWLGEWTTMPEAELRDRLEELEGRAPTVREMTRARQLFAAAIETPGRLRIQTIHAFCERLLQQFPFEASVTAGFQVVDERGAAELLAEARATVLRAAGEPGSALDGDLARLAEEAGDETLGDLFRKVVGRKGDFRRWIAGGDLDDALARLADALGLKPGEDEAAVMAEILDGGPLPRSEWEAVAALCDGGSANDSKQAERLRAAMTAASEQDALEAYRTVFLTSDGEPRKSIITQTISKAEPSLATRLETERARVHALCDTLKAARILSASASLFRIADKVLDRYEALKGARGQLDYDDLIERTASLLGRADAAWILYKLDGGLDHVLVDEAQDTSPGQWEVVAHMVAEFFAGRSSREVTRTIFAVGDEKQSIYSFQGADPRRFAAMRGVLGGRVGASGQGFAQVPLTLSFRSTHAVLRAVDLTFESPVAAAGLTTGSGARPDPHDPVRVEEYGRVELWPVVEPEPRVEPDPWDAPFDVERADSPPARLARRIAATIQGWLRDGEVLEATGERVTAGDVMILVRNRNPFAGTMIRALKEAGVTVAGADRLVLTEHIAVMDLMALGRFCLMPEDDLNLAALLKSPLLGLSEDDLMEVAVGRTGGLWDALAVSERFADAARRLASWRDRAGFERPYEFYARVLGAEGMRRAFHRRLGNEAFEAIDEFLSLALQFERAETPSLAGFLHWLEAAPTEVKRDMDKGRNEVRVMTVHGAKGLEAPIVFLADTCRIPAANRIGPVFRFGIEEDGGPLVWTPRKPDDCAATRALREAAVVRQREEENRLLYVAMTRARDRLYVTGFQTGDKLPEGCWYELVAAALKPGMERIGEGEDGVWRYESGRAGTTAPEPTTEATRPGLPGWAGGRASGETGEVRLAPSHLADHAPATGPGGDPAARRHARRRGIIVHRLLESLPDIAPAARGEATARALTVLASDWSVAEREEVSAEVLALLDDPAFADAFLPGGKSEVSVAGRVEGIEGTLVGQIDRLGVNDSAVSIVDYKTDRVVPADLSTVPPAYLAQMEAYRGLVRKLHPGKEIRVAILWTAGPVLMEIPPAPPATHG